MSPVVKRLLMLVGIVLIVFIAFQVHWLLGIGVAIALVVYTIYINRSLMHALKANAAYAQGDEERALALLEKVNQSKHRKPQQVLSYAFLLMKSGKPEQAEEVLNDLLRSVKATDIQMMAKSNLATAYWLLGKQDESIRLLEEVHEQYKTVTIVGNLGYFKILQGDLESALAFNEEAYEYDDQDKTIVDNLAQTYYLLGRLEDAAKLYGQVMEQSPKYAETYYYYARTLEELGRLEDAAEQAQTALEKPQAIVTNITRNDLEQLAKRVGRAAQE